MVANEILWLTNDHSVFEFCRTAAFASWKRLGLQNKVVGNEDEEGLAFLVFEQFKLRATSGEIVRPRGLIRTIASRLAAQLLRSESRRRRAERRSTELKRLVNDVVHNPLCILCLLPQLSEHRRNVLCAWLDTGGHVPNAAALVGITRGAFNQAMHQVYRAARSLCERCPGPPDTVEFRTIHEIEVIASKHRATIDGSA